MNIISISLFTSISITTCFSFFFFVFYNVISAGCKLEKDDSTKFEVQKGPCILQYNEPCYSNKRIKFFLYSNSYDKPVLMDLRHHYFPKNYDSKKSLKVLIHGFSSSTFLQKILTEYLVNGISNVLLVDWQTLANRPCYVSAAVNTWQVGKCTGVAIQKLAPETDVHLVGFSLGAHVAGYAGNYLKTRYGRTISRITGLDPALPFFATPLDDFKLDAGDAHYVDVIHTSMGVYGKLEPCGTQDFYVNTSPVQPGCENHTNPTLCSHWRATNIFAESIRSEKGFWAKPCQTLWSYLTGTCTFDFSSNRVLMGEYAKPNIKGIFVIKTKDAAPFALG